MTNKCAKDDLKTLKKFYWWWIIADLEVQCMVCTTYALEVISRSKMAASGVWALSCFQLHTWDMGQHIEDIQK